VLESCGLCTECVAPCYSSSTVRNKYDTQSKKLCASVFPLSKIWNRQIFIHIRYENMEWNSVIKFDICIHGVCFLKNVSCGNMLQPVLSRSHLVFSSWHFYDLPAQKIFSGALDKKISMLKKERKDVHTSRQCLCDSMCVLVYKRRVFYINNNK